MIELALAGAIVAAAWLATRRQRPAAPSGPLVLDVSGGGALGAYLAASAARAATVEGIADSAAREGASQVSDALSPAFVGYHGGTQAPRWLTTACEPIYGDVSALVTPWLCRPAGSGALGPAAGMVPVAGGVVYSLGYDRAGAWGEAPMVTDGDGVAWLHVGPSWWIGAGPLASAMQREHAATGHTARVSALLWRLDWPRLRKDAAGSYFVEGLGVADMRAGQFSAALYARMDNAAREVAALAG